MCQNECFFCLMIFSMLCASHVPGNREKVYACEMSAATSGWYRTSWARIACEADVTTDVIISTVGSGMCPTGRCDDPQADVMQGWELLLTAPGWLLRCRAPRSRTPVISVACMTSFPPRMRPRLRTTSVKSSVNIIQGFVPAVRRNLIISR